MGNALRPVAATREPDYPEYGKARISRHHWKQIAAALGASAALWLPACSILDCGRTAGDPPMVHHTPAEEVRAPGALHVTTPDAAQPVPAPTLPEQPTPPTAPATATPTAPGTPNTSPIDPVRPGTGIDPAALNALPRNPGGPSNPVHPRNDPPAAATPTAPPVLPE